MFWTLSVSGGCSALLVYMSYSSMGLSVLWTSFLMLIVPCWSGRCVVNVTTPANFFHLLRRQVSCHHPLKESSCRSSQECRNLIHNLTSIYRKRLLCCRWTDLSPSLWLWWVRRWVWFLSQCDSLFISDEIRSVNNSGSCNCKVNCLLQLWAWTFFNVVQTM